MYVGGTRTGDYEQAGEKPVRLHPELTPGQEMDCEALIIYMFDVPGHTVTSTEVGHHVREVLDIDKDNWRAIANELVVCRNIIKMGKSNPDIVRNNTMTLNLPGLIEAAGSEDKPGYITPLLVAAAERLRDEQKHAAQSVDIGLIALVTDTPILAEPS